VIAALALALSVGSTPAVAGGDAIWFLMSSEDEAAHVLCLQRPDPDALSYRVARRLTEDPQAIATHGASLWLAPAGRVPSLLVVSASWDASLGHWLLQPKGGFTRLPSPPLEGRVVEVVPLAKGPLVLAEREGEVAAARLEQGQWSHVASPPWPVEQAVVAAAASPKGAAVLTSDRLAVGRLWMWDAQADLWSPIVDISGTGVPVDLVSAPEGLLVGLQMDMEGRSIVLLQDGQLRPWMTVQDVDAKARLVCAGGDVFLFRFKNRKPELRSLNLAGGQSGSWEPMIAVWPMSNTLLVNLLLVALVVTTVLLFGAMQPVNDLAIPSGWALASLGQRTAACAIDLLPGLVVGWCTTGLSFPSLTAWCGMPSIQFLPMMMTIGGVTALWGLCWEPWGGRTPGKWIMRITVMPLDGRALRWHHVLRRNLVKGVLLVVPPLLAWSFLTPWILGLDNLAGRTMVCRRA